MSTKDRSKVFAQEVGGGLNFAIGGAVKYAPTLDSSDDGARTKTIEARIAEARSLREPFTLTDRVVSPTTRDALAVWKPVALWHLLSLEPTPPGSLAALRKEVSAAQELVKRWSAIECWFDAAIEAIGQASVVEPQRSFPHTAAALRKLTTLRTTGVSDDDRMLHAEDGASNLVETLEQARGVLLGLSADAKSRARVERSRRTRAQKALKDHTGASTWNLRRSRTASRRLATLVDALRDAFPERWPWPRVAELVQASQFDWVTPPSPRLATRDSDAIISNLKMRYSRERRRIASLGLTFEEIYPWRGRRNKIS